MRGERPGLHDTPWCVVCRVHGHQTLTLGEYRAEMNNADARWSCPVCGSACEWDDDNYELHMGEQSDEDLEDELDFDADEEYDFDDEEEDFR